MDKTGRPSVEENTASFQLCLSPGTKRQLERQPYSAFQYSDSDPLALNVSVLPESRLHLDNHPTRFEHFSHWWRVRHAPRIEYITSEDQKLAEAVFDNAFPSPFEDDPDHGDWCDRNEFVVWADELLFVITARGFLAGTLQLHVKLLDARARTRSTVLEDLRPLISI